MSMVRSKLLGIDKVEECLRQLRESGGNPEEFDTLRGDLIERINKLEGPELTLEGMGENIYHTLQWLKRITTKPEQWPDKIGCLTDIANSLLRNCRQLKLVEAGRIAGSSYPGRSFDSWWDVEGYQLSYDTPQSYRELCNDLARFAFAAGVAQAKGANGSHESTKET